MMSTFPIRGSTKHLANVVHPPKALHAKLIEVGFAPEPSEARCLTKVVIDEENPGLALAFELRRIQDKAPEEANTSDLARMISGLVLDL